MNEDIQQKITSFFAAYHSRKYSNGQILILSGDDTDYVFHLVSGVVKEYEVSYRGDEMILSLFKPPAFFPMSVAINNQPCPYIFEAETDIEVIQAPADEVLEFVKQNPDVMFDLLSRVYRGVDGLLGRLTHLMSGSAKSRLMYELVIESRRFGQLQPDGSVHLALSEKDLGTRAGLSRETISRELNKLKTSGLVSIESSSIVIHDLRAVETQLDHLA